MFRLLNPELHMKPNAMVGFLGTALFVGIMGSLYWEKRKADAKRKEEDERQNLTKRLS